jgi:hypothetical protein
VQPRTAPPSPPPQTSPPVIHRATAPAPQAPVQPGDADDQNLDVLAKRLYTRIRARLKADLLLDRERAGMAVDAR